MEIEEYDDSLKVYRDIKNSLDTAEAKGRAKGITEVASKLLAKGMTIEYVADVTGLSEDEIKNLGD